MGRITIPAADVHRLLDDAARPGSTYQQVFTDLAATMHGRPVADILPLLRAAAADAQLSFTSADLADQAVAISRGTRYELRVRVTPSQAPASGG
ncbi:hypothetical protein [Streptomyces hydrogenans]|uniref:hypothetical protein n=1 Tax=Streptomyces hydrogenans TaxID=1873719 RepID=UPI0036EF789B